MVCVVKYARVVSICLLFVLIIPFSQALSIDEFSFLVGQQELTAVAPGKPQQVVVHIDLTAAAGETVQNVRFDLRPLNSDPQRQIEYADLQATCQGESDNQTNLMSYSCEKPGLIIYPTNETTAIPLTIQTSNETLTSTFNITFSIDNTRPNITSITTDYMRNGKYYVKSRGITTIRLQLQDDVATFSQRKIFYKVDDLPTKIVDNCTTTECTGKFLVTCSSGSQIKVVITDPSSDDAGNPVTGQLSNVFRCDNEAPAQREDVNITVKHNNPLYPAPREGENITITALVTEDVSGINALANLSEITPDGQESQAGECTPLPGGETYSCTWQVRNVIAGDGVVDFLFTDGVGREAQASATIHVDNYIRGENITVPSFFKDVVGESGSPLGFNRIALGLAHDNGIDFPIFGFFTPQAAPDQPAVQALTMYIDPTTCELSSPNFATRPAASSYFDNIYITNALKDYGTTNRIDFELSPSTDVATLSDVDVTCEVSASVRVGDDTVYQQPTTFLVTIPLEFRNSALSDEYPGQEFARKIQRREEQIDGFWQGVGIANNIAATMSGICSVYKTLSSVSLEGRAIQLGVSLLGQAYPGARGILDPVNRVVGRGAGFAQRFTDTNSVRQRSYMSQIQGTPENTIASQAAEFQGKAENLLEDLMEKSCEWTTCSMVDRVEENPDKWYFQGMDLNTFTKDNAADLGGLAGMQQDVSNQLFADTAYPDPSESIISAVMTKCWSALIYHLHKFRQMKCGVLICMKEQARFGLDVSVCEQAESQYLCQAIVGEFFELPYVRQVKNIADNANNFMQLIIPNTLKIVSSNTFCQNTLDSDTLGADGGTGDTIKLAVCYLPEAVGNKLNYYIKSTPTTRTFNYPIDDDYCEMAKDCVGEECEPVSSSYLGRLVPQFAPYEDIGHALELQDYEQPDTTLDGDCLKYEPYLKASQEAKKQEGSKYLDPNHWDEGSPEARYVNHLLHGDSDYGREYAKWQEENKNKDAKGVRYQEVLQDYISYYMTLYNSVVKSAGQQGDQNYDSLLYHAEKNQNKVHEHFIVKTYLLVAVDYAKMGNFLQARAIAQSVLDNYEDTTDEIYALAGDLHAAVLVADPEYQEWQLKKELKELENEKTQVENEIDLAEKVFKQAQVEKIKLVCIKNWDTYFAPDIDQNTGIITMQNFMKHWLGVPRDSLAITADVCVPALGEIILISQTPQGTETRFSRYKRLEQEAKKVGERKHVQELNDLIQEKSNQIAAQQRDVELQKGVIFNQILPKLAITDEEKATYAFKADELEPMPSPQKKLEDLQEAVDDDNLAKINAAWEARHQSEQQLTQLGNDFVDSIDTCRNKLNEQKTELTGQYTTCVPQPQCAKDVQRELEAVETKLERLNKIEADVSRYTPEYMTTDFWQGEDEENLRSYVKTWGEHQKELEEYENRVQEHQGELDQVNEELGEYETNPCENKPNSNDCETYTDLVNKESELTEKIGEEPSDEAVQEARDSLTTEEKQKLTAAAEEHEKNGKKFNEEEIENTLKENNVQDRASKFQQNLKGAIDIGVSVAIKEGWLNWAVLTNFGKDSTAGQVSDFSETWLDPDSWKQGMCSSDLIFSTGGQAQPGIAISCENNFCQPVLTQAAERIQYNETHYVYTLVYYLKNIPSDSVLIDQQAIRYSLYLKTDSGQVDRLFANTWEELGASPHDFAKSFRASKEYTQMCIEFEVPFPAGEPGAKRSYCRNIVDAQQGTSAFKTGDPLAPYLDEQGNIVSPSSSGGNVSSAPFELAEQFT